MSFLRKLSLIAILTFASTAGAISDSGEPGIISLPEEIIIHLAIQMAPPSLLHFCSTCHYLNDITNNDQFWQKASENNFIKIDTANQCYNWKEFFKKQSVILVLNKHLFDMKNWDTDDTNRSIKNYEQYNTLLQNEFETRVLAHILDLGEQNAIKIIALFIAHYEVFNILGRNATLITAPYVWGKFQDTNILDETFNTSEYYYADGDKSKWGNSWQYIEIAKRAAGEKENKESRNRFVDALTDGITNFLNKVDKKKTHSLSDLLKQSSQLFTLAWFAQESFIKDNFLPAYEAAYTEMVDLNLSFEEGLELIEKQITDNTDPYAESLFNIIRELVSKALVRIQANHNIF